MMKNTSSREERAQKAVYLYDVLPPASVPPCMQCLSSWIRRRTNKCCGQLRQMYVTVFLRSCELLPLSHESHQMPALFALSVLRNVTLLARILVFHPGCAVLP